jgi:hypothetical protein
MKCRGDFIFCISKVICFAKLDIYRSKYPQLKLQIKGLEIMQDDPSMARVLYGDVVKDEGHEEVQKFGRELLSRLDNAGT